MIKNSEIPMIDQVCFSRQEPFLECVDFNHSLFRYHRYRNHRLFDKDSVRELAERELRYLLYDEGTFGRIFILNNTVSGVCLCQPLSWDSLHFGIEMASLNLFLSDSVSQSEGGALVAAVMNDARKLGFKHLCANVDADDYVSFNSLIVSGFQLMDAKRTFVSRPRDTVEIDFPKLFEPREYRNADRNEIISLIERTGFESRFSRDPAISDEKSRLLYVKWAEQLFDAPENKLLIYVVERKERKILAASGGFEVEIKAGDQEKKILTDGIFACKPRASGSYLSMMRRFILEGRRRGYALVETKVSLNNRAVNKALAYIGGDAVSCHYALHASLRK